MIDRNDKLFSMMNSPRENLSEPLSSGIFSHNAMKSDVTSQMIDFKSKDNAARIGFVNPRYFNDKKIEERCAHSTS